MEKKIKTLYILSIIAILAFLGMQVYWLFSRYEYSLREYEDQIKFKIENIIADYRAIRLNWSAPGDYTATTRSNYNMEYNPSASVAMRATVTSQKYSAHELLGIKEHRLLTEEEREQVAKMIDDGLAEVKTTTKSYDTSNAPSEAAVWGAMKNIDLEIKCPFTTEGIDSLLLKSNIRANVNLVVTDSIVWTPMLTRHTSIISPEMQLSVPYSELDRQSVVIECKIPISEVLKKMGWTLVLAVVLSIGLILCLVWQINTIVKLTRLDKMRNMFITTMIHELKRPISTLKMCVSGIENEKMLADKEVKTELMSGTRTALDNLSAYFSKLRDITFNNVEQIPLNITKFNLSQLVDDVVSSVSIPSAKPVKFENHIDNGLEVSADKSHIFNIINNLVENAVKYSGDSVEIKVEASVDNCGVLIKVSDTGNGIPESDLSKIFTRFYRGKASFTDIPGMGLGLAYVKLLAEAHGGKVSVVSQLGEGTSFTINLPQ